MEGLKFEESTRLARQVLDANGETAPRKVDKLRTIDMTFVERHSELCPAPVPDCDPRNAMASINLRFSVQAQLAQ
jgi:hypothetical protein